MVKIVIPISYYMAECLAK